MNSVANELQCSFPCISLHSKLIRVAPVRRTHCVWILKESQLQAKKCSNVRLFAQEELLCRLAEMYDPALWRRPEIIQPKICGISTDFISEFRHVPCCIRSPWTYRR